MRPSLFLLAFEKAAGAVRRVSCVAVLHDGKMLMGVRRDNGKWTSPGGHGDPGETPLAAAVRELYEESGIRADPKDLKPLREKLVTKPDGSKLKVSTFVLELGAKVPTSMKQDPDGEVFRWRWVDYRDGLPPDIVAKLHVPLEHNVILQALGVGRREKAAALEGPAYSQWFIDTLKDRLGQA